MDALHDAPVWLVCLLIFLMRVADVSVGTIRTIAVVRGRPAVAVVLGFFEVLIWLLAIAQVLDRALESPVVALFYAGGYAAGNGIGILIERKVSSRLFVLRIISSHRGREIAAALAELGHVLGIINGEREGGAVSLVYASVPRSRVPRLVERARAVDPELFFLVEPALQWSENLMSLYQPTGWRAVFKRK